jgi:hypothetical protein
MAMMRNAYKILVGKPGGRKIWAQIGTLGWIGEK